MRLKNKPAQSINSCSLNEFFIRLNIGLANPKTTLSDFKEKFIYDISGLLKLNLEKIIIVDYGKSETIRQVQTHPGCLY